MKIIKHAFLMVKRTISNYMLLSITALISFSTMFSYLIFTDSNIYNKYREILGADSEVVLSCNSYSGENMKKINMLIEQIRNYKNTKYYYISQTYGTNTYGGQYCEINIVPDFVWGLFEIQEVGDDEYCIPFRILLDNNREVKLLNNEAIVSKQVYDSLDREYGEEKKINLSFVDKNGKKFFKSYNVVGKYQKKSNEYRNPDETKEGDIIYISDNEINNRCEIDNVSVVIKSDKIEKVNNIINKLDLSNINSLDEKNNAILEKRIFIKNKYIIAMLLFALLSVNIYSSFTNALKDRKFEIGVKRALGASRQNIMLQFLVEGVWVMLVNIFLSIQVGIAAIITYKFIKLKIYDYVYVITLSRESIILYFVFTVFISLLFSMVFAYKSTHVEIVKYLKEEL